MWVKSSLFMDKNFSVQFSNFSPLYLDKRFMVDWLRENLNTLVDNGEDVDIMYDGWYCDISYDNNEKCYCLKSFFVEEVCIKLN